MRVEPIASATSSRCASLTLSIWRPLSTTLPAGNDVEMGGGSYSFIQIPRRSSPVAFSRTHTSATQQRRPRSIIHTKESVALARQIDTESIVLHENHNILPLSKTANVAVIGPMEHGYINYGDYVVNGSYLTGVSPYDGIKAASSGSTTFTQGCERWLRPIRTSSGKASTPLPASTSTSRTLTSSVPCPTSSRPSSTGKPTVVVFSSGKPINEAWISEYQSEEGGNSLADILFGNENPFGKLSAGFLYDVGTTPVYYDYLNSGRPVDIGKEYEDGTHHYSTFEYGPVKLSKMKVNAKDTVTVSVDVTNKSTHDGADYCPGAR
ncbi:hypothetical protein GMDG_02755 [Pseudogymnoascus destructans 20631-21]|uniref:Glycoside hydrolase family 3 C-terminal domain-containing protein n=1 Tax=Pseudogymnoascus destructans (strain ATCC MYA-4855 / 20631-21) TaxID=658429 RepID=L8G5C1_PSED2|nr:hypothetical protein GMDG_02755 [Pseudogymnoascus destructans 20631-21]